MSLGKDNLVVGKKFDSTMLGAESGKRSEERSQDTAVIHACHLNWRNILLRIERYRAIIFIFYFYLFVVVNLNQMD